MQNCKAYAKKSIQYVPTLGWAWKFAESIFLERNWDKDKEMIGVQMKELADFPDAMWVSGFFFLILYLFLFKIKIFFFFYKYLNRKFFLIIGTFPPHRKGGGVLLKNDWRKRIWLFDVLVKKNRKRNFYIV